MAPAEHIRRAGFQQAPGLPCPQRTPNFYGDNTGLPAAAALPKQAVYLLIGLLEEQDAEALGLIAGYSPDVDASIAKRSLIPICNKSLVEPT